MDIKTNKMKILIKYHFGLLSEETRKGFEEQYNIVKGDNGGILSWQTYYTRQRIYVFFIGVTDEDSYLIGSCRNDPKDQFCNEEAIVNHWMLTGETGFLL